MQKCDYCGYITKYNVNHCPSCGATRYTKIDSFNNYEVKNDSKRVYKCLNGGTLKHSFLYYIMCFILAIIPLAYIAIIVFNIVPQLRDFAFKNGMHYNDTLTLSFVYSIVIYLVILICSLNVNFLKNNKEKLVLFLYLVPWGYLGMMEEKDISLWIVFYLFFFMIFPIIAFGGIREYLDSSKGDKLIKKGMLIKNVKYELVPDENNSKYNRIKVNYESKDGVKLNLISSQCINFTPLDDTVDILIDKTNLNNYYIDFEIV